MIINPKFKRFKWLVSFLITMVVILPILIFGNILKNAVEDSLLHEKEQKLFGITHMLDQYLVGDYNDILKEWGAENSDSQTQVDILNKQLKDYTDALASAYPGVGVGYYVKDLNAIVTYGPSSIYHHTIGDSIEEDHPGRAVMAEQAANLVIGDQVRGNIMNAMKPIIRDNEVIGYVWANELLTDVDEQLERMDDYIFLCLALITFIVVFCLLILWNRLLQDITLIKQGLKKIHFNLNERITGVSGWIEEVADEINDLAANLQYTQTFSEHVLNSTKDGVLTIDTRGNITYVNKAATEILSIEPQHVVGRFYLDGMPHKFQFNDYILETLNTGKVHSDREEELYINEKQHYIRFSTFYLLNSSDRLIGYILTLRDISEKKRLEQQIHRADRLAALGEMVAGVAHEIRNPLTAIKSLIQYLDAGSTEEERQEFHPVIVKEIDRVKKILDKLLYFSKPSKVQKEAVDINQLLKETVHLIETTTRNNIRYYMKLMEDIPLVYVDPEQFKQVFLNLLINSVQAIEPDTGVITLESCLDEEGKSVILHVSDTGKGVIEEDIAKVFDPFYTSKKEGTGLGLSVVQRIIMAHNGDIWLRNLPSGGVQVTMIIPIHYKEGPYETETHSNRG